MANKEELTPKQKLFCEEYLKDLNWTQAAIRAWYSDKSARTEASRLLTKDNIIKRLWKNLEKKFEKTWISVERVLQNLQEIIERSMQRKPVMIFDKENKEYIQKTEEVRDEDKQTYREEWVREYDSVGAIRANELIGKYLKMFIDQHQHKHSFVSEWNIYDEEYEDDTE